MSKLTFFFVLFLSLVSGCFGLRTQKMDLTVYQRLKTQEDYINHFIFYNQQTFLKIETQYGELLDQMTQHGDVIFYLNDCNSVKMKECETKDTVPLMLLFNRVFIRFNGGKGSQNKLDQIYDWIQNRISISPVLIHNKQQLTQQLLNTPELFCYCNGIPQEKAQFYSLTKAMILTNYGVIENKTLCQELGLKQKNVTLFKNGTLEHRIQFQYQNRYPYWQNFLKINVLTHVKRSSEIFRKRFAHENKTIDTTIVLCDFSYKCEKFWMEFQVWSRTLQKNHPEVDFALSFFDQRQYLAFNTFLHVKIDHSKFPSLINVKLFSSNEKAGWLRRYIRYPSHVNQQEVISFEKDIEQGKVIQQYLSGELPAKNGFTGKNAQKLIQKIVASNLNQTISKSEKHYVLLLGTFGIGCQQCEQFYKEFKKVASFLRDQDITFGFMDTQRNEINVDAVTNLPQVLLFNKYLKNDPSRMGGKQSFDNLMRFLQNNAIINYTSDL